MAAMQYEKFLRWAAVGGLFLIPVIPFIISTNMFFPFITGKNFFFRILVELLTGVWFLLALRNPAYRPRFSWILAALGLFTLWMAVATGFSVDPAKSFWSNFERMEGYITVIHLFAYFLVAASVLQATRLWTRFFEFSVVVSAAIGVYAFCQVIGFIPIDQGATRVTATLGNAIYFGIYLVFNLYFALFLLWREPQLFEKRYLGKAALACGLFFVLLGLLAYFAGVTHNALVPIAAMAAAGLALMFVRERAYFTGFLLFAFIADLVFLFMSESRGPMLGFMGGLIVTAGALFLMTRGTGEWRRSRRIALYAAGALVVLALLFMAIRQQPWIQSVPGLNRLASISLTETTVTSRLHFIWPMAWKGFLEKPVTGWGQENFNFVFNKYYDPHMWNQEQWFDRTHNSFLDWLIAGGFPAFLLYLSLFVLAARALWRSQLPAPDRAILLGLMAAYAFHSLFVFDNIVSSLYFFTLLGLAHALSQREVPAYLFLSKSVGERGMAVMAPAVAVVFLGGAWALNAPGISSATTLIRAISTTNPSTGAPADLKNNLGYFKEAVEASPLGRQEAVEQFLQFALSIIAAPNASPELKAQYFTGAGEAMERMIEERPGDARLELFFGSFLSGAGQLAPALEHLKKAQELSPRKQTILFEMGVNVYLRSGDTENALNVLRSAFEAAPEYSTARIYYAAALYKSGRTAEADALIIERWGSTAPTGSDELLQAYYSAGLHSRAEAIVQARIALNPADSQLYLTLAAIRYAAGDKPGAIAALEAGARANEDFAAQAQMLITQIRQEE